jgi:Transglycosylase-like domain
MDEGTKPPRPARRRRSAVSERPDRIALWAFVLAVAVMIAAAVSAHASTGGASSGGSGGVGSGGGTVSARYQSLWNSFPTRTQRWAHRTSRCESGNDPTAVGGGGRYRGAFQFTRPTWHNAPRSPGGDPVQYPWVTQAVVAVLLKHHVGTSPWPRCG